MELHNQTLEVNVHLIFAQFLSQLACPEAKPATLPHTKSISWVMVPAPVAQARDELALAKTFSQYEAAVSITVCALASVPLLPKIAESSAGAPVEKLLKSKLMIKSALAGTEEIESAAATRRLLEKMAGEFTGRKNVGDLQTTAENSQQIRIYPDFMDAIDEKGTLRSNPPGSFRN